MVRTDAPAAFGGLDPGGKHLEPSIDEDEVDSSRVRRDGWSLETVEGAEGLVASGGTMGVDQAALEQG
ncbi:MAG: hypothetical protein ACO3YY_09535, partial [Phycisphaerales bacterium]